MAKKKASKKKLRPFTVRLSQADRASLELKAREKGMRLDKFVKSILRRAASGKGGGLGNRTQPNESAPTAVHKTAAPPGRGQPSVSQTPARPIGSRGNRAKAAAEEFDREMITLGMPANADKQSQRAWIRTNTAGGPLIDFFEELSGESDRGCVIVSQAFLDAALVDAVRSLLRSISGDSDSNLDALFDGERQAPLGGFSARVRIARSLGLIDDRRKDSLFKIRDMRNKAAHVSVPFSLAKWMPKVSGTFVALSDKEKALLDSYAVILRDLPEAGLSARRLFEMSVSSIFLRLLMIARQPTKAKELLADEVGAFDVLYDDFMDQFTDSLSKEQR